MFIKARNKPLRLLIEEAPLRRLPKNHKKWSEIQGNLKKIRTGYKGECELDYHLKFLPEGEYYILCDVRIPLDEDLTFQLDTLILTPQFALIIESKNIYGTLYFDHNSKQVFRTFDGKKEGLPDPVQQVKRQKILFQRWLARHMNKSVPVHTLISIGLPGTIIETSDQSKQLFDKVLHAEHIPDKILHLIQKHPTQSLTSYQIKKVYTLMLEQYTPHSFDALAFYKIPPADLITGIPCPNCIRTPML